jgi:putative hydrolase of the HAD superfamily
MINYTQASATVATIPWSTVDTVFIDLDGTCLDLDFDDFFWLEYVPQQYAQAHQLEIATARTDVYARYQRVAGTLNWYSLDYWRQELGLAIHELKSLQIHRVRCHDQVEDVLKRLQHCGKQRILTTNAHPATQALKLARTQLEHSFEAVICAHTLGCPKEDPQFWSLVQQQYSFDSSRSVFIDDTISVLNAARTAGPQWLIAMCAPRISKKPVLTQDFINMCAWSELLAVVC